jgi:lipoate-protein ligase B
VHLLGQVDFDACLALQQRLVYEVSGARRGPIPVLICEHPASITIGRQGSRCDVKLDAADLAAHELEIRWVNRGGGAVLHLPGQLAIYPIVPLERCGFSVGEYLARLQCGLLAAIVEAGCYQAHLLPSRHGVWGRTGPLAAIGAAVKNGVSYYGAYVNVCPAMRLVERVVSDPEAELPLSSLLVERHQPVRMSGVRERIARHLADSLTDGRYHLHTGHPLLPPVLTSPTADPKTSARAG